jgi:GTP-binding protein
MNAQFLKSAARPADFPPDRGAEVAVVGRSNSGKSSAINRIVGIRKLARVSKTPGRTQLINFFEIAPERRLVDLPGYGFARVPDSTRAKWQSLIEAYFEERRSLRGLIVTVDIRRGFMEPDRRMIDWAASLGVEVLALLSKADKLSRGAGLSQQRAMAAEAREGVEVALFSATSGLGVDTARRKLQAWLGLENGEIKKPRAQVSGDAPGAKGSRLG